MGFIYPFYMDIKTANEYASLPAFEFLDAEDERSVGKEGFEMLPLK